MKRSALITGLVIIIAGFASASPIMPETTPNTISSSLSNGDDRVVRGTTGRIACPDRSLTERCGDDCDDGQCPITPEMHQVTFEVLDEDSDGDGIPTVTETERLSSSTGEVVSGLKSERPKFKAGSELSKTVSSAHVGDLDGDGLADVLLSVERDGETVKMTGGSISKRSARTGIYMTETPMKKAELIEAIASDSGLSKADSKRCLNIFMRTAFSK